MIMNTLKNGTVSAREPVHEAGFRTIIKQSKSAVSSLSFECVFRMENFQEQH